MTNKYQMKNVDFWVHHMAEFHANYEHTWEWAWVVCPDGEIHVRDGPWWIDTGIYCTRRVIKGCEWE